MLQVCAFRGCETLTLSTFCVKHEQSAVKRAWPKGRPFPDYVRESAAAVSREASTASKQS